MMLIIDSILYMLLAVYIEGVWPGDYGLPKPWYFPFTVRHSNNVDIDQYKIITYRNLVVSI